jgi:hypothetical protein
MKTRILAFLVTTFFAFGTVCATSSTAILKTTVEVTTQQNNQVVSAIYVGNGKNAINVLIRISNGYVVAICSGRDYQGHQIWDDIQPVKIQTNTDHPRSSRMGYNTAIMDKQYMALLGGGKLYF